MSPEQIYQTPRIQNMVKAIPELRGYPIPQQVEIIEKGLSSKAALGTMFGLLFILVEVGVTGFALLQMEYPLFNAMTSGSDKFAAILVLLVLSPALWLVFKLVRAMQISAVRRIITERGQGRR
jgi:hypothetical protein